jgi:hypothetical protein
MTKGSDAGMVSPLLARVSTSNRSPVLVTATVHPGKRLSSSVGCWVAEQMTSAIIRSRVLAVAVSAASRCPVTIDGVLGHGGVSGPSHVATRWPAAKSAAVIIRRRKSAAAGQGGGRERVRFAVPRPAPQDP